jgi:hypothetical protein
MILLQKEYEMQKKKEKHGWDIDQPTTMMILSY